MTPTLSRRDVLQVGGSAMLARSIGIDSAETSTESYVPRTREEILAAFDELPRNRDPTDVQRGGAQARFPPYTVPDTGPIPTTPEHRTIEVVPPRWALGAAVEKARWHGEKANRRVVDGYLLNLDWVREDWVLPDGRDAITAVLEAALEDADVEG